MQRTDMTGLNLWQNCGGKVVMVLGCIAVKGAGALHQTKGQIEQRVYLYVVKTFGFQSDNNLLGKNINWKQDNHLKHTARSLKCLFSESGVVLMQ